VLLVATMFLSDIINNAAAAVLMAPIGLSLAQGLELKPQAFLMAVAIGASCAFLTPIGHQSNTLVCGPGGYRFGDYWKLGLPVQIVMVAVAIPLLLWFWPLR
jgi:di/tricarboxylate transporter